MALPSPCAALVVVAVCLGSCYERPLGTAPRVGAATDTRRPPLRCRLCRSGARIEEAVRAQTQLLQVRARCLRLLRASLRPRRALATVAACS
eukprot:scaffold1918_cov227-Prasinococcus_capsulatus_cf.AAC.1